MNPLTQEPAAVSAAVMAIFGMLVALQVFHLTDVQIGSITSALSLVLGLFVRQSVTPVAKL